MGNLSIPHLFFVFYTYGLTFHVVNAGTCTQYALPSVIVTSDRSSKSVTNGAATNTVNIQFYHADTASWSYISRLHSVVGGTTYNALDNATLFLHSGDKIAVFKTGGTIDATISAKQYYNPARS